MYVCMSGGEDIKNESVEEAVVIDFLLPERQVLQVV